MTPESEIQHFEEKFSSQIAHLTDALERTSKSVDDLSVKMQIQNYQYQADAKINDFKIEALQRLFKRQEVQSREIAAIKKEQAETRGSVRMLKWLLGFVGLGGVAAVLKFLN